MAFGGPALGPLASSFIQADVGFRWNLRVMAIFSGIMSLLAAFVPETHGPTLLKWRIKKEGNAPPALSIKQVIAVYKVALARPIVYLFTGECLLPILRGFSLRQRSLLCRDPLVRSLTCFRNVTLQNHSSLSFASSYQSYTAACMGSFRPLLSSMSRSAA